MISYIPQIAKLNIFSLYHYPITLLAYLKRAIHSSPAIFISEGLIT